MLLVVGPNFKYTPSTIEDCGIPKPVSELAGAPPADDEETAGDPANNPVKDEPLDAMQEDGLEVKNS